jgi:Protein of unknown function (DUF1800)
MGQRLFFPSSVAGWPAGLAWLGGQQLVARANFTAWISGSSLPAGADHFAGLSRRHGFKTAQSCIDSLAALLLGAPLARDQRVRSLHPSPELLESVRVLISLPEAQLA